MVRSEAGVGLLSEATVRTLARAQITAPSELLAFDFDDAAAPAPRGFERLAESALLRRSDLDAVGDELLSWAARGVAMGQAPDEVKDAADEVTGPIENDGAADVLRSLL